MKAVADIKLNPLVNRLWQEYHYDPDGIVKQADSILDHSFKNLVGTSDSVEWLQKIEALSAAAGDDMFSVFPTRKEIKEEFIPLMTPLQKQYPFLCCGLSISSPVSNPGSPSLNIITRLFDKGKRIRIKIKIAVFLDSSGRLFYEAGFVDMSKSLQQFKKNFVDQRPPQGDFFLLYQLNNCIRRFIDRRKKLSGLDLTPAYYHVLPLSFRLGARPVNEQHYNSWKSEMEQACLFSLPLFKKEHADLATSFSSLNKSLLISWMFENNLVRCPYTGKTLNWSPPRLVCSA